MNILSVNTGVPKSYTLDGVTLETSMIRIPQKKIDVQFKRVVGDIFKGTNIHGIPDCVVYALSIDRYKYWSDYLGFEVGIGFFGENLSVDKLREEEFFLGDEYQAGSTLLKVTAPRYPCNRLNFVSGNKHTRDHFAQKAWPGVYFEVLTEGSVQAQDKLVLKRRIQSEISVLDVFLSLRSAERREPISDRTLKVMKSPLVLERHRAKLQKFYDTNI